jgi:hypothetical protein
MHVTRRNFSTAALLLPAAAVLPPSVWKQAVARAAVGGTATIPLSGVDAAGLPTAGPLLLVRDELTGRWTSLGAIAAERGEWLRQLVSFATTGTGWRRRVAFVLPDLESSDPLVAEIAASEVARAPYSALGVARSRIDPERVEKWLANPKLARRHSPYTLLLGFAGSRREAALLAARIEKARAHRDTNLAAMLTADLELRGPSRVGWIETMYFGDRGATMPEIEAALLALAVHGDTDATVPRARVIQAYRFFMRQHPPMAGFVAPKFESWGYWDAASEYAGLLESHPNIDPASKLAIDRYLQHAANARAAMQYRI